MLVLGLTVFESLTEPLTPVVHDVWIKDQRLNHILENKVIVQLSDLHIWSIGSREKKVLEIVNQIKPDIIFLTGDYVSWKGDYGPALEFMTLLKAKIGVWAVMGDYDYSDSRKSCLFCHDEGSGRATIRHHVRFLKDSREVIKLAGGEVSIAGIDGEGGHISSPPRFDPQGKNGLPMIVLSHNPLSFDLIPEDQSVLMLAGDTHGGQIPLPGWLFDLLGYQKNARFNEGFFEQGRKKMYVSRGIGTSHLPIRLFRKPEVVVIHFVDGGNEH